MLQYFCNFLSSFHKKYWKKINSHTPGTRCCVPVCQRHILWLTMTPHLATHYLGTHRANVQDVSIEDEVSLYQPWFLYSCGREYQRGHGCADGKGCIIISFSPFTQVAAHIPRKVKKRKETTHWSYFRLGTIARVFKFEPAAQVLKPIIPTW